jgi:hypothetical protein
MRVEESSPSSWTRVLQAPERSLASLFFNPRGNLHLAAQSLVEALVQDLNDLPSDSREGAASLEQSLSYQRVKALVRERAEGKAFQFKITAENEDLLISPLYPGGKPAGAK